MQSHLFIGGNWDSLNVPAPDEPERYELPVGVTGKETYHHSTLSLGDVSIVVYVHESLTLEQALNLLVKSYKAWAANQPSGRR